MKHFIVYSVNIFGILSFKYRLAYFIDCKVVNSCTYKSSPTCINFPRTEAFIRPYPTSVFLSIRLLCRPPEKNRFFFRRRLAASITGLPHCLCKYDRAASKRPICNIYRPQHLSLILGEVKHIYRHSTSDSPFCSCILQSLSLIYVSERPRVL